jgi:hypothetical protein
MACNTTGIRNVALGENALAANTAYNYQTAVGWSALQNANGNGSNVALGALAGKNVTTGGSNVIIGPNVNIPNATGSCQLAIGFNESDYWLTGCSDRSIQPSKGVRDCNGNLGTNGQALLSTGGNTVVWGTPVTNTCYYMARQTTNQTYGINGYIGEWGPVYGSFGTIYTRNGYGNSVIEIPIGGVYRIDFNLTGCVFSPYQNSMAYDLTMYNAVSQVVQQGVARSSFTPYRAGTAGTCVVNQWTSFGIVTTATNNCAYSWRYTGAPFFNGACISTYADYGMWMFTRLA